MRIIKYMIFLVAVLAFMVFMGHQETLSPEETLVISEFEKQSAQEQTAPPVLASETPPAPSVSTVPATTTVPVTAPTPSTIPPVPAPTIPAPTLPNGTVLEDSVNVRSGPGLDFPVITQLYKGDQVVLGDVVNGFYQLTLNGRKCYISADFVAKTPTQ